MEPQSCQVILPDPTHLMVPCTDSPHVTFATQNGKILFLDLKTNQIVVRGDIFNSQINCLRNTGAGEVLASSYTKEVFYGKIDSKGAKEGISFATKGESLNVDISEFIVAVGSEEGDICRLQLNLQCSTTSANPPARVRRSTKVCTRTSRVSDSGTPSRLFSKTPDKPVDWRVLRMKALWRFSI